MTSIPAASGTGVGKREAEAEEKVREEPLGRIWAIPPGLTGRLSTVQNNLLGSRIITAAFILFLLGGINALLMRTQLAVPDSDFMGPDTYNQLFTMHGSTMMFLYAVPILEGFAIFLLPTVLGNREMPFPRLGAFSLYTFIFGAILFYASFFFDAVPDAGWFAYAPLSGPRFSPGIALDFWLLALSVAEVAAIAAGTEIIIAILRMRAPGMTLGRMPIIAWAYLVMAFSLLFGFTPLIVGSLLLELDRKLGTQFFNAAAGGNPVLWQHLFWIFGHPEVYIQFIPAAGFISMIIPTFSRQRLTAHTLVVVSLVATGFISFGLWVHHMFTVGLPEMSLAFFAAASLVIGIPSGIQVFAWITTILRGRPIFTTSFLFAIGFIVLFVLGGITGIMVGSVPFDWQVHDSFFVVAHFHYVLIGGVVFPVFAAFYYWMPSIAGKMLDERLGKWNFWLMFIGFNLTFFPMHIAGFLGMPRRVYTYQPDIGLDLWNLLATAGAYMLALGILVFIINVIISLRRDERAGADPWEADTLEWATAIPQPNYGFARLPIVRSRHPLWEQESLHEGDEKLVALLDEFAEWPTSWRAAMVTSMVDAKPQEIFRVNGPSLWPLSGAIGMGLIFGAEIFSLRWLVLIGVLTLVVSIIGWHWPDKAPTTEAEERAFEERHGIAVRSAGSRVVSRAGMSLAILILAIAAGTFLLSYFYIRLEHPVWPPPGLERSGLLLPGIATLLLLAGFAPMVWAMRSIRDNQQRGLKLGLVLALLLGLAGLGVLIWDFTMLDFTWSNHAYGSLFYALGGYAMLLSIIALAMAALTIFWNWRRPYTARHYTPVENLVWFWGATVVMWLLLVGTIYLGPYVT